jgi:cell wall-associated NlpC family hydrolase
MNRMAALKFDKRLTPARPDLADERLRGRVAAERYSSGHNMRVVAPSAPLRREPRPDAPLDTEALMGETITVYAEDEGWAWGQLQGDGYVGYLPSEALQADAPEPTHWVAALRTFVYPAPHLKVPPSGFVGLGAAVAVADMDGAYARLAPGSFIFAAHLAPVGTHEPDFVSVAERLVGTPYLWGGKTSLGLDCSGLVQLSLTAAGILAPRDTDMQQAALGEPIDIAPDLAGLRRGDLIFWKGHMGVMVDAERLLHANAHHMAVAVEPLLEAEKRIRGKEFGLIEAIRRLPALGGQ